MDPKPNPRSAPNPRGHLMISAPTPEPLNLCYPARRIFTASRTLRRSFAYSAPVPSFPSQTSPPHIGSLAILHQRGVSCWPTTKRFSLRTQLRLLTLPIASLPCVPRGDPPDSKSGLPPTRDVSSSARSSAVNSYAFSLCAPAYFAFLLSAV